jgi:hypothetical protein
MTTTKLPPVTWAVPAVAVATAVTWWAWLGWDTEYDVDPVTGSSSGPYQPWQVIGCVLSLMVIGIVGTLVMRPWIAPVVLTLTFLVTWSWQAARTDESGLWLVGAVLLLFGLGWGSTAVSVGTWLARRFLRGRPMEPVR